MDEWGGRSKRAQFWRSIPTRSYAIFLFGVFFMFLPTGLLGDIAGQGSSPPLRLVLSMILSGTISVAYIVVSNRPTWFPVLIAAHILIIWQFDRVVPATTMPMTGAALQARLNLDTTIVSISLIVSFMLLSQFVKREGLRYVRAHTEISLARDIHRLLVPPVTRRIGGFEFCGVSIPSGEVGGDLIDLVESDGRWIGYVADVSGHGVGAGLLMGMTKSAAHTQLRVAPSMERLQNTLNAVLFDLKKPDMYVTYAGLQFDGMPELEFSVAGHLPILRYCPSTATLDELTIAQVPLAMFEDRTFVASRVAWQPGDLFVILTDGLTDVFDKHDSEFGLDRIKAIVREHARSPLETLQTRLLDAVKAYGPQLDDQTVLLIRAADV
jgi:serine phosphatase RsbU (regulator of sigma subunit)